jgi:S-DNA-T family DNA segregation ATPase FtsK/SpoIIIE
MATKKEADRSGWSEASGIMLLALCVLVVMSLFSYDFKDIRLLHSPPNLPPKNFIGPVGAWFSFVIFTLLGVGGYFVALGLGLFGVLLVLKRSDHLLRRLGWMCVLLLAVVCLVELQPDLWESTRARLNVGSPGGILGEVLAERVLIKLLGQVGAGILLGALVLASVVFTFDVQPMDVGRKLAALCKGLYAKVREKMAAERDLRTEVDREARALEKKRQRLENALEKKIRAAERKEAREARASRPEPEPEPGPAEEPPEPVTARIKRAVQMRREAKQPEPSAPAAVETITPTEPTVGGEYQLPPMDLIDIPPAVKAQATKADFAAGSQLLEETLREFGIEGTVTDVQRGPVVTRFEVLPAPGVRVERISNLANNIALAMKAETVRVQAPIPGKGVVGIEVPNPKTTVVYLREILESAAWTTKDRALPLCLGKDVSGREIVGDLADMPHLLVAGATGSGKTVCMNSILAGLLMTRTPDEMRLMLVDPKIVEFSGYNNLPHLVVPVITDAKKVSHGLRWAIDEMEKRYKMFAKVGVRNIKGFNERPLVKQGDLFGEDEPAEPKAAGIPDRLPYIVIIVDELADLMLVAQAEVEHHIARLAQLSRAVGIHMIIATQRPSVNVITGTIKANFPARIAFKVAQKVDSRTILDANGADTLLGKGDMLFLPPGSHKLIRAQGALTGDTEISRIVSFIEAQTEPSYEPEIRQKIESKVVDIPEAGEDDLMETAVEIIRQTKRASTSSLQRRLRIGYTRAARLMDLLEEKGVVGPPRGSDPREILIDLDGEIPTNEALADAGEED